MTHAVDTMDSWLPVITRRIVEQFAPLRIILFGSRARGSHTSTSDVDLLVVLDRVVNHRSEAVAIRRALRDIPVAKDVLVATPEDIARQGDMIGSVLRPALREGQELYARL